MPVGRRGRERERNRSLSAFVYVSATRHDSHKMVNGARAKLLFICQSKYNKGPRSASPPSLILALALAESGTTVRGRTAACDQRGRNTAGTGQRNEPHAYGHKVDTTHIDTQTNTGYGKNVMQ